MNTYIYALIDPTSNYVRYVGKSVNPKARYSNHINQLPNKPKFNFHKYNWVNSLKEKGMLPELFIIDEIDGIEWEFWEQYYISLFRSWGFHLLNKTIGGDGSKGHIMPNHVKETLRKSNIGRIPWNKGKKGCYGTEQLQRMTEGNLRTSRTPAKQAALKRMHENAIGKKHDKNWCNNISNGRRKIVMQYSKEGVFIAEYKGLDKANEITGVNFRYISACCKGTQTTAGGYIWSFK